MYNSRSPYMTSPSKKIAGTATTSYPRSPVNYTRTTPDTAAKRSTATTYEPNLDKFKVPITEEADLWRSRCNDLESSLVQANTDLELANFRARKAVDGDQRIEELVRVNNTLSLENEGLAKQSNQRKAESDIWRQKYETQMNNVIQLKTGFELEVQKLKSENARLHDELKQGDVDKVRETEDAKFKLGSEAHEKIETLKKAHAQNLELYEEQIKKLRHIVQDREMEINKLNSAVSQTRHDGDWEANRLQEDREKLKLRISEIEIESHQALQNLRSKLDNQTAEQLDSLKYLHDTELEVMSGELHKLRNLLDVKTKEIEALIDQNKGLKRNFDEETHNLRVEIAALKDRIAENNEFANREIANLHDQLNNQHATDIQGLKFQHQNQIEALNTEVADLNKIVQAKTDEIENQLREKQIIRDNLTLEIERLSGDIDMWKVKFSNLDNLRRAENEEAAVKYDTLNAQQNEFAAAQRNQIKYLETEVEHLKELLTSKNQEIDVNRDQNTDIRDGLNSDLKNAFADIEDWKKKYNHLRHTSDVACQDLKTQLNVLEARTQEQKKKLDQQIQYLKDDIARLKDTIDIKEKEVKNLNVHRDMQDREIRKLKSDNDSQSEHLRLLEKQKAHELDKQRAKLEASNNLVVEQIKSSHQNQVDILNTEIEDLKHICNLKDVEVNDMIAKYDKLESQIGEFKFNADKLKEHQTQVQALGNEIINNKSIYDSYSKSRHARYPSSATKNFAI